MFVGNLIFLLNFIGKDYDVLLSDIETAFSNENMVEQQSLNGKSSKSISLYNKLNRNDQLSSTDKLLSILWNDMVSSEREEAYSDETRKLLQQRKNALLKQNVKDNKQQSHDFRKWKHIEQ